MDRGQVSDDDWRRSGLTVLSEEPGNVVVLFSEDQLAEFARRADKFAEPVPEGKKTPAYQWIASLTTEMELWGRTDRIGAKLSKVAIAADEMRHVDVRLWQYGNRQDWEARMGELRNYVLSQGGEFLNFYVSESLSVARVRVSGATLERLLEIGIVENVDLPPQPDLRVGEMLETALEQIEVPVEQPPDGSAGVCIIDSGIAAAHPLLGPCIGETVPIPASLVSGVDEHGHGTKVAGIALYGDVGGCIDAQKFQPELILFGARVTNHQNRFDDENSDYSTDG